MNNLNGPFEKVLRLEQKMGVESVFRLCPFMNIVSGMQYLKHSDNGMLYMALSGMF